MHDVIVEARTVAPAARIWALWVDVAGSPAWDLDVDWSRLHGPFQVGTRGEFKLKGGPRASFILDEVIKGIGYANVVRMPGMQVRFTHTLTRVSGHELRVSHGAQVSGPLAWLLRPLVRRMLKPALSKALENMIALAETAAAGANRLKSA